MHRVLSVLCVGWSLIGVVGSRTNAQGADVSHSPHRQAIGLSFDAGGFPDAFSTRCGLERSGGGAGFGAGLSAIARPRTHLVVGLDLRASAMPDTFGCILILPLKEVGPNEYETRPGLRFPAGTPGMPLLRSLFKLGVEEQGSGDVPLLRATVGAGMIVSSQPAPVASFALGIGSHNAGTRFYMELERDISRARGTQTRERFRTDSANTSLGSYSVTQVLHPAWTTLHLGIEIPMG